MFIIALILGSLIGSARADGLSGVLPGHSKHGEAFDDGPTRKSVHLGDVGRSSFVALTSYPEALTFIQQGVAQLHSFAYYEAERSFRTAAVIDPGCPMACWGMAMANVNNAKRARGFLAKAEEMAIKAKVSRRERLYLDATESLHKEGTGEDVGVRGWIRGLEAVVQEAPDDLDARAWLALAIAQGGRIESRQAIDIVLDSVLKADPLHPGAHHYRIHLWEGANPGQALGSASTYAGTAPGIAHAWHMPGHTYTELHRYPEAAYHQEAAARVDHAAMTRNRTMPFETHNHAHNNQWLCTSLAHDGRARDAIALARNLVEQPRDPEKNRADDPGSAQRLGRLRWAETLIRFELWDDLITATTSGALDWSDVPRERIMRAYGLGLAHAAKGEASGLAKQIEALKKIDEDEARKVAEARARKVGFELDLETASRLDQAEVSRQVTDGLRSAVDRATKDATAMKFSNPEAATRGAEFFGQGPELSTEVVLAELHGHQLLADGDIGGAFVKFYKATVMRPESRARAHLKIHNAGFAVTTAGVAIDRAPGEVSPLAAYVEVMATLGREDEARESYRRLLSLARRSDRDLPVFRRLTNLIEGFDLGRPQDGTAAEGVPPERPDLTKLGPMLWSPFDASAFTRPDDLGKPWSIGGQRERPVILLFYLGGKCAPCMQQLRVFREAYQLFHDRGIDLAAVSTESPDDLRYLRIHADGLRSTMPLLGDPTLEIFRLYGAFDEFEDRPLHGIFLIDAQGKVRWRRVSADPFLDIDFLKTEAIRLGTIGR